MVCSPMPWKACVCHYNYSTGNQAVDSWWSSFPTTATVVGHNEKEDSCLLLVPASHCTGALVGRICKTAPEEEDKLLVVLPIVSQKAMAPIGRWWRAGSSRCSFFPWHYLTIPRYPSPWTSISGHNIWELKHWTRGRRKPYVSTAPSKHILMACYKVVGSNSSNISLPQVWLGTGVGPCIGLAHSPFCGTTII